MTTRDIPKHTFWVPLLIVVMIIGLLLFFTLRLVAELSTSDFETLNQNDTDVPSTFISFFDGNASKEIPHLEEASSLLDTAPVFMPTDSAFDRITSSLKITNESDLEYSFPNYPAEIQLDGAQFAVAARMSIPVSEAVDLGLGKLRESSINFQSLGRGNLLKSAAPIAKRACQINITHIENGRKWKKDIQNIEGSDTLNPLWEPMILFAAMGDTGIDAYPSPANTTGIAPLDKKLTLIASQILENLDLPIGNYRIEITP